MAWRALVVDDDKDLCLLIKKYLEKEAVLVDCIHSGAGCLSMVEELECYQLVVLDVMLPEIDGFSVLTEIRKFSRVPILMLTARGEEADRIKGLKAGADDYLPKPFSLQEFTARAAALIRRYTELNQQTGAYSDLLVVGNLTVNFETRIMQLNGEALDLTAKEFNLVAFLARHKNRVFTKEQIYEQVWGQAYACDDANIMAFISRLRGKLSSVDPGHRYIQTLRGVGYRFCSKE